MLTVMDTFEKGSANHCLEGVNRQNTDVSKSDRENQINSEILEMIDYAYGELPEDERIKLESKCEKEEYLKDVLEEIVKEKAIFAFTSKEKHIDMIKKEAQRIHKRFNDLFDEQQSNACTKLIKRIRNLLEKGRSNM